MSKNASEIIIGANSLGLHTSKQNAPLFLAPRKLSFFHFLFPVKSGLKHVMLSTSEQTTVTYLLYVHPHMWTCN